MTGVNGWIWATLVGLSVLVPVVAAVAAFRAAPAAGIDPGRTALAVGSSLGIWWLLVVGAGGAELFRADSDAVFPVIALAVGLPIIAGLVVLPRLSGFKRLTASIPQPGCSPLRPPGSWGSPSWCFFPRASCRLTSL